MIKLVPRAQLPLWRRVACSTPIFCLDTVFVLTLLLLQLGCENANRFYRLWRLRDTIQHKFNISVLSVTEFSDSNVVVNLYNDPRDSLSLEGQSAFAESVAVLTLKTYRGKRLASVGVSLNQTNSAASARRQILVRAQMVFVPEYEPNGQLRLARLRYVP